MDVDIIWRTNNSKLSGCEERIITLYHTISSVNQLHDEYKVAAKSISDVLFNNGIKLRNQKEARNLPIYNQSRNQTVLIKFDPGQIKDIVDRYNAGDGVAILSKNYNVDDTVIKRILKEQNISLRDPKTAREQCMSTTVKNRHNTIIKKYGSWDEIQKIQKETYFKKYGINNPMQNAEIFLKQQQSARRIKELIIEGKIFSYQGYEEKAIRELIDSGINVNDIIVDEMKVPKFYYQLNNETHLYYPDICVFSKRLIIEVKCLYTLNADLEKNKAKQEAVLKNGYNFEFWIYEQKDTKHKTILL